MKKLPKVSNIKKVLSGAMILSVMAGASLALAPKTQAAGITNMSITGTGITSNSSNITTAVTPTVNFTTATALSADGQTIIITLNGLSVVSGQTLAAADLTLTGITLEASPGTADNGAAEVAVTNGASTNNNPVITITLDSNATVAPSFTAGAKTLAIAVSQLQSSTTASNYQHAILTSADTGSYFYYVGDENAVTVTGTVNDTLSFVIRNTADTADQANINGAAIGPNECAIGIITTGGVSSCSYRLKIATNAASGYTVTTQSTSSPGTFHNGSYGMADAAATTGTTIAALTENYGAKLESGSVTGSGGSTTRAAAFGGGTGAADAKAYQITNTTEGTFFTANKPNSPAASADTTNTALVTHQSAISSSTPSGVYKHTLKYRVSATF